MFSIYDSQGHDKGQKSLQPAQNAKFEVVTRVATSVDDDSQKSPKKSQKTGVVVSQGDRTDKNALAFLAVAEPQKNEAENPLGTYTKFGGQNLLGDVHESACSAPSRVDATERKKARVNLWNAHTKVSSNRRCRLCGFAKSDGRVELVAGAGAAHFRGVKTDAKVPTMWFCGSVWCCPRCSAVVRNDYALEVATAVLKAIDEKQWQAIFITVTIPHDADQSLKEVFDLINEAYRKTREHRGVKSVREAIGYEGAISAHEVTCGGNGWHPHIHMIWFCDEVDDDLLDDIQRTLKRAMNVFYAKKGYKKLHPMRGVTVEQVHTEEGKGQALARYVSKLQDGSSLGNEMTRSDLKRGRKKSVMPFEILAAYVETGDTAMLALWQEYEAGTKGKSAIRFSPGLRAKLGISKEKSDEERANKEEEGGTPVMRMMGSLYNELRKVAYVEVLDAVMAGGFEAVVKLLVAYGLDHPGEFWEIVNITETECLDTCPVDVQPVQATFDFGSD